MSIRGNSPALKTPQAADYADLGKLFMRNDGLNRQLDVIKNGFINGAFDWNQRGQATYTVSGGGAVYGFDRWGIWNLGANGSVSMSSQTFGLGDVAPESSNFIRVSCTGHSSAADGAVLYQPIENVRRFSGRRCVLVGKARRYSGAGSVAGALTQNFGTGGTAPVSKYIGQFTPSAVWAPFAMIVDVPALTAAQVLGALTGSGTFLNIQLYLSAGSNNNALTNNLGLQTIAVDFAELEFKEIAPGSGDQYPGYERLPREIELVRSLRYLQRGTLRGPVGGNNSGFFTQYIGASQRLSVPMRTVPSLIFTDANGNNGVVNTGNRTTGLSSGGMGASADTVWMDASLPQTDNLFWWFVLYTASAEI